MADIPVPQRIALLKKIHLFHSLDEDQLAVVAAELQEESRKAQETVVRQGEEANSFYIIYTGKVSVTQRKGGRDRTLATLVVGDYFGEEALLARQHRNATVIASEDALFFVLLRENFNKLLKQVPQLKLNFEVAVSSRRLARRLRFKWLEDGEVIYFLARKHPALLLQSLVGPVLAALLPGILFVIYLATKAKLPLYLAGIIFLLIVFWAIWNAIDWGNDYYIVTNQRAVWLEKIIGTYDSRQEAPLSTILSVGIETDQLGRMLGYGDVIVRTFVGRIPFHHVSNPTQAASLVEEHWTRAKVVSQKSDADAMKQAIR